jgi:hypothetical protein
MEVQGIEPLTAPLIPFSRIATIFNDSSSNDDLRKRPLMRQKVTEHQRCHRMLKGACLQKLKMIHNTRNASDVCR